MAPPEPLPQAEFDRVYARVPRLTVEVVIASDDGVLLARRTQGPCRGLWHIPGGTVRLGEPLTDAVRRVADAELGADVVPGRLLGYIEYPSHFAQGLGWPVGVAFLTRLAPPPGRRPRGDPALLGWFRSLPEPMHDEQRRFLRSHRLVPR